MNQFIQIYNNERTKGKSPECAFSYAAGNLAFGKGTIDELQDLYVHFVSESTNDFLNEMEESTNEEYQTA